VVERTFAWLGRNRRLSKDDEELPCTEDAWIYLAVIRLLLARLTVNFGAALSERTHVPGDGARLDETRLEDCLTMPPPL
jgi:hypothetical protein